MTKTTRKHAEDLRAASKLAVVATSGIIDLVEEMHRTIASGPGLLGRPFARPARALTGVVYGPIRKVTELVGVGLDAALSQLGPLLGESAVGPDRDAILSVLNGALGDYLSETKNPLAIEMTLRHAARALPVDASALHRVFPRAGGKILILVHGSSMNDRQWNRGGHDYGTALAHDLGYAPVYVHYNSGLHISTNGRVLVERIDELIRAWPIAVDEISVLGHSMGGLVARSACHIATREHARWRPKLRRLVCLGSPHHGAPLERGGSWIDTLLGVSAYSAPMARLGRIRSAGVTDLRFGNVLDEHWEGQDRFAPARDARSRLTLPSKVACYTIAGTTAKTLRERLPGDGLVPVNSALGRHARPDLTLNFPDDHQWIAHGTGHLDLLSRPEVYAKLRGWFAG